MDCDLCRAKNDEYRLIKETKYSFSIICKSPLKEGHIMVLPKKCVSQHNFSELNPEESKDLLILINEMENRLNEVFKEDAIIFKNSQNHSTQDHLHFHILPSKGSLRDLMSEYEKIPKRENISKEEYIKMRDKIKTSIKL